MSPAFLEAFYRVPVSLDFSGNYMDLLVYSHPWRCGGLTVHMHGPRQEPEFLISLAFVALMDVYVIPSKANWQAHILGGWR